MTEFRAVVLTIAAGVVVAMAAMVALHALHANGTVLALAFIVILTVTADTCSRIGMRYSGKDRRR